MASCHGGMTLFYGRNDRAYKRHPYQWKRGKFGSTTVHVVYLFTHDLRLGLSAAETSGPRASFGLLVKWASSKE